MNSSLVNSYNSICNLIKSKYNKNYNDVMYDQYQVWLQSLYRYIVNIDSLDIDIKICSSLIDFCYEIFGYHNDILWNLISLCISLLDFYIFKHNIIKQDYIVIYLERLNDNQKNNENNLNEAHFLFLPLNDNIIDNNNDGDNNSINNIIIDQIIYLIKLLLEHPEVRIRNQIITFFQSLSSLMLQQVNNYYYTNVIESTIQSNSNNIKNSYSSTINENIKDPLKDNIEANVDNNNTSTGSNMYNNSKDLKNNIWIHTMSNYLISKVIVYLIYIYIIVTIILCFLYTIV